MCMCSDGLDSWFAALPLFGEVCEKTWEKLELDYDMEAHSFIFFLELGYLVSHNLSCFGWSRKIVLTQKHTIFFGSLPGEPAKSDDDSSSVHRNAVPRFCPSGLLEETGPFVAAATGFLLCICTML